LSPARPTFARPRPTLHPAPAQPAASGLFANRYVSAATAAAFFLVCAAGLVSLTGDPKAGAPVVRLSLAKIADTEAPPGWREVLPSETPGEAPYVSQTVELSSSPEPSEVSQASGGAAIITIPADARLDGAQAPGAGLAQAPIAGLTAQGAGGPLPVIAPDGRTAAQA